MGITKAELDDMSDEEMIAKSDQHLEYRALPSDFFLNELHRRNMRKHTKAITALTAVITVATIINVGLVVGSL